MVKLFELGSYGILIYMCPIKIVMSWNIRQARELGKDTINVS